MSRSNYTARDPSAYPLLQSNEHKCLTKPNKLSLAIAIVLLRSKPADLAVRDYIHSLRQHIIRSPAPRVDGAEFWKERYEQRVREVTELKAQITQYKDDQTSPNDRKRKQYKFPTLRQHLKVFQPLQNSQLVSSICVLQVSSSLQAIAAVSSAMEETIFQLATMQHTCPKAVVATQTYCVLSLLLQKARGTKGILLVSQAISAMFDAILQNCQITLHRNCIDEQFGYEILQILLDLFSDAAREILSLCAQSLVRLLCRCVVVANSPLPDHEVLGAEEATWYFVQLCQGPLRNSLDRQCKHQLVDALAQSSRMGAMEQSILALTDHV